MEQSEIIRMAREAGFKVDPIGTPLIFPPDGMDTDVWVEIQRFAALVAAYVTEALTKSHEEAFQSYVDQAKADRELGALAARLGEREACAKVCEEMVTNDGFHQAEYCATAIRARSE